MGNCKRLKVIQINTVCNGSTGGIMGAIQRRAIESGFDAISCYGRRKGYADFLCYKFGTLASFWIHVGINTIFDLQGTGSYFVTRRLVRFIRREKPDIIHLHNLHGYYINLNVLFRYLKEEFDGQVIWTFHDLWPITGHCPHFVQAGCNKWIDRCHDCPQKMKYPISYGLDMSQHNYAKKKRLFTALNNLTIICPSDWMRNQVRDSFLKDKDIRVIKNGINTYVFRPREPLNTICGRNISDRRVVLGVAGIWEERKGLKIFRKLAEEISDEYIIVLVGLGKRQIKKLPHNIIGIEKTSNVDELARIYSTADVFVNPSVEESFSLVTAEALACGTPVVVLDTSAVEELVTSNNGIVLHEPTISDYLDAIKSVKKKSAMISEEASLYSIDRMTLEVMRLYHEKLGV